MHDPGPAARTRLGMAAATLLLALASCTDALSPRQHGREGTVVQLSQTTRAELVSPAPGILELRFVAEAGGERVQSFQGEIRFNASRHRVLSATAENGTSATWHAVEPGRIRFAGVATEGITGRGIVFRFEEGESFRAADFELAVEEAILRADVKSAAVVRFSAAGADGTAPAAGASASASAAPAAGASAAQVAWEMRGDVNGDGGMDAVDALAVLAHVVGRELPATFAPQPQGDVSRDGAVTAADALLILEYRVGRDRVVDVRITSSAGPVELGDSLVLSAEVRGVRGDLRSDPVQWSCPDGARECGPHMYRPAIVALPSPAPVRLVASSGGVADTLVASVFEGDLPLLQVMLTPYPATVSSDNVLSQQKHAIRAMPGGTTTVFVSAVNAQGWRRPRVFRLSVADTTLFSARLGEVGPEWTPVVVTGRRTGSGTLIVLVNGVSIAVRVEVAAPVTPACSPSTSLSLDLAPGEMRTFRGSDPGAPSCLDFRAERDRGRQYMVLTYALPYSTGRVPNSPLEMFDFEGQALFYSAGEAIPPDYPVFRFYTSDVSAASLAVATPGAQAAQSREAPGHRWRVGGATVREGRPRRERAIHQLRPGARGGRQGPRLSVSGATASIQVGDTLVSPSFATLDWEIRTTDGGLARDRAVVTHVGENLVIAEHLDVLAGRLIGADGRTAARIPEAEYAKIDAAYGRPKRQLDRLFGGPYTGTVAGRDGGGRELAVNMPLGTGVWGYAHGDMTTINYWSGSFNGQPNLLQTPLLVGELLLAHEFTHVRHFQQWSERDTQVGPWVVEGFADFGSQLAYAARALGSETPSRTGRAQLPPAGLSGQLPSMDLLTSTLFRGYEASSFVFAYLADQVEAGGGDGLRAARDLALSAHSRVAAEQAIQRHLPGHSLTDVIARAEAVRYLEFLRKQQCGWCNGGDPVPPALHIAPDLPPHTRYLQYDHAAMGNVFAIFTAGWPILRPGSSSGTAYQLRAGTSWPIFIDGTDPLGDAQYLVDLSSQRQTVITVVRIR